MTSIHRTLNMKILNDGTEQHKTLKYRTLDTRTVKHRTLQHGYNINT